MKSVYRSFVILVVCCTLLPLIISCAQKDDDDDRSHDSVAAVDDDDDESPVNDDSGGCVDDDQNDDLDDDVDDDADDDTASPDDDADDDASPCPEDMAWIDNGKIDAFCMDKWEASRPDASADAEGAQDDYAASVAGVIPWKPAGNAQALQACADAGKTLCTPDQWYFACAGPDDLAYAYGNAYGPYTCNGIDAFSPDPHHLAPTGSFPQCVNQWGVYDLNGNLWERVLGGDDTTVRGGAYNCSNSLLYQRCDYIPGWTPSALGFRCCKTP